MSGAISYHMTLTNAADARCARNARSARYPEVKPHVARQRQCATKCGGCRIACRFDAIFIKQGGVTMKEYITLTVDGKSVKIEKGSTLLEAARKAGGYSDSLP